MRDILFRGKCVDNGEWVYGYYANCARPSGPRHHTHHYIITYPGHPEDYHEVYISTISQYIGLTDKHGKKIFEGDIIKIHNDYTGDPTPFDAVVAFRHGDFVCQYIGEDLYNRFSNWNVPYVWWEIIGNVKDNPEILKEGVELYRKQEERVKSIIDAFRAKGETEK